MTADELLDLLRDEREREFELAKSWGPNSRNLESTTVWLRALYQNWATHVVVATTSKSMFSAREN